MLRYRHSLWSPVWDVGSSVQVSVAMRELGRGEGGGYDSYIAWFPAPPKRNWNTYSIFSVHMGTLHSRLYPSALAASLACPLIHSAQQTTIQTL